MDIGWLSFLFAPPALAGVLLWRYPAYRRLRLLPMLLYLVIMSGLVWGALRFVAYVGDMKVLWPEVAIILWFTIAWRLAWTMWARTVGRGGQRWVRWARLQRRRGAHPPVRIRFIPLGRAALSALVFFPLFMSMAVTHRCKLGDGHDPGLFGRDFETIRIPTADGLTLDGWFIPTPGAERTILICHGAGANKGNFLFFLGGLPDRGYNVVFFDFRAHGAGGGRWDVGPGIAANRHELLRRVGRAGGGSAGQPAGAGHPRRRRFRHAAIARPALA